MILEVSQIVISSEEIKAVRVWLDPLIISLITWFIKSWINKATRAFHELVTENSNRVRDDVIRYVDAKLVEHVNQEQHWIMNLSNSVSAIEKEMLKWKKD